MEYIALSPSADAIAIEMENAPGPPKFDGGEKGGRNVEGNLSL